MSPRLEPGFASMEPWEPEEPKSPITEGEALCRSCLHAPVCIVADAINRAAPEGGIEVGACGLYLPFEDDTGDAG